MARAGTNEWAALTRKIQSDKGKIPVKETAEFKAVSKIAGKSPELALEIALEMLGQKRALAADFLKTAKTIEMRGKMPEMYCDKLSVDAV